MKITDLGALKLNGKCGKTLNKKMFNGHFTVLYCAGNISLAGVLALPPVTA
jgi:hypothetical protein